MNSIHASDASLLQTDHGEVIHDAQLDYYGTLLATCSSDTKIKVFDVKDNANTLLTELAVHEGAVWQVCWSHPKAGVYLASCSVDGKAVIHHQLTPATYERVFTFAEAGCPINCIAWAPPELGPTLACGAANGSFYLLKFQNNKWDAQRYQTPSTCIHSLSWAPFRHLGSLEGPQSVYRIAMAGGDNAAYILKYEELSLTPLSPVSPVALPIARLSHGALEKEDTLQGHKDLVQSIAWSPTSGLPGNTLATCSQTEAKVWTKSDAHGPWTCKDLPLQETQLWHISWSLSGHYLAITYGEQKVSLWRQSLAGEWIEEKRQM